MYDSQSNKMEKESFLRTGFILTGIALIISAVALMFLDFFAIASVLNAIAAASNSSGFFVVISFLFVILALIFLIVIGAIVIRMGNSLNYQKTLRLGIFVILMFIFLGIANFMTSAFLYSLPASKIGSEVLVLGIITIVGGIFIGSALIVVLNRTKTSNFIASILGIIGMPLVYYGIFSIPGGFGSSFFNTSHQFANNVLVSFFVPTHILFPIGFFMSFDYIGLVAGILLAIIFILSFFEVLKEGLLNFLYFIVLLIFSIGEIVTGGYLLSSSSVNNFSRSATNGNILYGYASLYTTSSSNSNGLISLYQVFQSLAIIFSIIVILSGVFLILFFVMNLAKIYTPIKENLAKGESSSGAIKNNKNASANAGDSMSIKDKLVTLKEQLDKGLITKDEYDQMKEELLDKL